jgi:hypothetical protein
MLLNEPTGAPQPNINLEQQRQPQEAGCGATFLND